LPEEVLPKDQANLIPEENIEKPGEQKSATAPTDPTQQVKATPEVVAPKPKEIDPRYAPIIVFSGAAQGTPSRGVGYEKNIVNLNEDPINSLQTSKTSAAPTFIKDRSHIVAQGKLITAVLETAINTELPGSVRGIVSRDVYGEIGNEVLIPRGSRLFGSYASKVSQGQARVTVNWTRLIRTDGVDIGITSTASDQFGRAGIPGVVDNKYSGILTNSILTSVLAVGSVALAQKLLTNNSTTTTTTNATNGTTTTSGSATNQAIYDVSKTITDTIGQVVGNRLDVNPVIRIPQGTKMTVIVNADIKIPSIKGR
jgi:type IV secretion system protein VirB10